MAFTRLTFPATYSDTSQYPGGRRTWRALFQILPDAIKNYLNNTLAPWMDSLERYTTKSGAGATASADQGPLTASQYIKLNYATEAYDYNAEYDSATSTFTVKVAGSYRIDGGIGWQGPPATNRSILEVWVNGAGKRRLSDLTGSWGNFGSVELELAINDAITLRGYTSNALTTDGASNVLGNYFTVTKIG